MFWKPTFDLESFLFGMVAGYGVIAVLIGLAILKQKNDIRKLKKKRRSLF